MFFLLFYFRAYKVYTKRISNGISVANLNLNSFHACSFVKIVEIVLSVCNYSLTHIHAHSHRVISLNIEFVGEEA